MNEINNKENESICIIVTLFFLKAIIKFNLKNKNMTNFYTIS